MTDATKGIKIPKPKAPAVKKAPANKQRYAVFTYQLPPQTVRMPIEWLTGYNQEITTNEQLLAVLQQEADDNMCDSIHQYLIDYEHIMPWDNVDEFEISFNLEEGEE